MRISTWPTMPLAWPDGHYGVGPLHLTNRLGREGRPKGDYRALHLVVGSKDNQADLLPTRDATGCADADDAMFTGQFFDEVLNDESHEAVPDVVRTQPKINWRDDIPVIDATHKSTGGPGS
jgi:hypothetical protein